MTVSLKPVSRRSCLKRIGALLAVSSIPPLLRSRAISAANMPPLPTEAELLTLSRIASELMSCFGAPGLSVAIAKDGHFVYKNAFGFSDAMTREPLTPTHLFRIASVTKPLTAACIFSFVEEGRISLDDFVFGERGLLDYGSDFPADVAQLKIYHLLTHTGGGWEKGPGDPMFMNPAWNHKQLIEWTLHHRPLNQPPGTHYGYSNFGYCLLGRVLEKLSGLPYHAVVQQRVLEKCGVRAMRIAGNTLAQRVPGEVRYHGQNGENPYNMNVARMDSHGGWIATPTEMVQFALHVDGFADPPDILRSETIRTMTTPSSGENGYACGWQVNRAQSWWHTGSLPGTMTILVRTSSGFCWSAFTNTRAKGMDSAIDDLMWKMVKTVPAWEA